jgi:hypothetical protein
MPQMWSRIELITSISPSKLRIILKCTKPQPLHMVIPSSASKEQLKLLSSATDRIVCMSIDGRLRFLQNQFPILERLELGPGESPNLYGLQCLSHACRFPKLREFSLQAVPLYINYEMMSLRPRFVGLQKLNLSCFLSPHWLEIIQGVSSTLVSLVLRIWNIADYPTLQLHCSFPRLRHLRIIKGSDSRDLTFNLDAPQLEFIEHVFRWHNWITWDSIPIRLRNPRSVKQLRIMVHDFDLSAYPALRKLWIDGNTDGSDIMLRSLGDRIASCQELETILLSDQYGHAGKVVPAFVDVIRKTGRDIAVREFLPTDLDLPGAMRRSVSIAATAFPLSS